MKVRMAQQLDKQKEFINSIRKSNRISLRNRKENLLHEYKSGLKNKKEVRIALAILDKNKPGLRIIV